MTKMKSKYDSDYQGPGFFKPNRPSKAEREKQAAIRKKLQDFAEKKESEQFEDDEAYYNSLDK